MDALVVFDSTSGNTEKIAKAVAVGIGGRTKAVRAGTAEARGMDKVELLVLGTPVLGGRPSPLMQAFMKSIPQAASGKLRIATFDTRMTGFAKLFGSAAVRMAKQLEGMGFRPRNRNRKASLSPPGRARWPRVSWTGRPPGEKSSPNPDRPDAPIEARLGKHLVKPFQQCLGGIGLGKESVHAKPWASFTCPLAVSPLVAMIGRRGSACATPGSWRPRPCGASSCR